MLGYKLFVAVVATRFDGAALEGFHTEGNFLLGGGLLMHEGVSTFIMAGKERGCGLTAEIAVDALLIDIKLTRNVWFPLVIFIGHGAKQQKACG